MSIDRQTKSKLKKIGSIIRALRKKKGWTLEHVEEHGWESWRHMQQIETGNKNLTMITLFKIADLYKVRPADLLKDL
jgi:transcriptional regulator with XRE-family HTH domain